MINDVIEPFKLAALERFSKIIGDSFTGSEITGLFRKAGFLEISHDEGTKWKFLYATFEDLQKRKFGPYQILKFLETVCDPQEYFARPEYHNTILGKLNDILEFYSLKINEKGKVIKIDEKQETIKTKETEDVKLFLLRSFHPEVVRHAREQFIQRHYFDAVDECCKAFTKYVSEKSKLDRHGSELMGKALSLKGSLKLNTQKTETERNLQEGLMHLCIGLMKGIRNSVEHEPQLDFKIDSQEALDMLSFISYLYRQIDKSAYYSM